MIMKTILSFICTFLSFNCFCQISFEGIQSQLKPNTKECEIYYQRDKYKNSIVMNIVFMKTGFPKKIKVYSDEGRLQFSEEYFYDDTFLIKVVKSDYRKKIIETQDFLYDSIKKLKEKRIKDDKGNLLYKEVYCQTKDSQIINILDFEKELSVKQVAIDYDSSGFKIRLSSFYDGNTSELLSKSYKRFDQNGLEHEEKFINVNGYKTTTLNYYDSVRKRPYLQQNYNDSSIGATCHFFYFQRKILKKCYKHFSSKDSLLNSIETTEYDKNGKIVSKLSLSYADTNDFDRDRLKKGNGVGRNFSNGYLLNIVYFEYGKIKKKYIIKYKS
jgi:hypothetical protein